MTIKQYFSPTSIAGASELLCEYANAFPLAGGTDLLVQSRAGRQVDVAIDLKRIPGATGIAQHDGKICIGAATAAIDLTSNPLIKNHFPGLAKAIDYIGSSQIQGRCTLGGNLCNASPAADTVPALIANGADVVVVGGKQQRKVAVGQFTTGPGTTVLEKGEFVHSLEIALPEAGRGDAYLRFTPRTEMDIAVVSAGVALSVDVNGDIAKARVAVGAVAATALRLDQAALLLDGQPANNPDFEAFAAAVRQAASPISDKRGTAWYRKQVVGVIAIRAAKMALENARLRGDV